MHTYVEFSWTLCCTWIAGNDLHRSQVCEPKLCPKVAKQQKSHKSWQIHQQYVQLKTVIQRAVPNTFCLGVDSYFHYWFNSQNSKTFSWQSQKTKNSSRSLQWTSCNQRCLQFLIKKLQLVNYQNCSQSCLCQRTNWLNVSVLGYISVQFISVDDIQYAEPFCTASLPKKGAISNIHCH